MAATGTSRGGFCALHFAAAESRVRAVAAISPVTNLSALREFAGVAPELAGKFHARRLGDALSGRAIWIGIGNDDDRVSTSDTIETTAALIGATRDRGVAPIPIELVVAPAPGHRAIPDAYSLAARFVARHVPVSPTEDSDARGPRTLLFADDHEILYRSGTERRLHPPKRHESPVLSETKPWELAIGYCSVQRAPAGIQGVEEGTYQLWYQAYAGRRAKSPTRRVVVGYAESKDGLAWTKPDLGLFDFNGDPATNIVLVGNGGRSVNYGAAVIVDPLTTDASGRYKMAYWDFAGDVPGLFVAFLPRRHPLDETRQGPLARGRVRHAQSAAGADRRRPRTRTSTRGERRHRSHVRPKFARGT